jgi:hypothetical protein
MSRPTDRQPPVRYYIDTEFIDSAPGLELISIGIVDERERTFYAVSDAFDPARANRWVQRNVLPHIEHEPRQTLREIRRGIEEFIGSDSPEFWGFCPSHDWVLFTWLWDGMAHLPRGFPGICRCLRQYLQDFAIPRSVLPPAPKEEHHALADAEWTRAVHLAMQDYQRKRGDAWPPPRTVPAEA